MEREGVRVPDADAPREGGDRTGVPLLLMYHSVAPYEVDPHLITVTPERFDRQMRWLRRRGLRGVGVGELLAARRDGPREGRGLVGLTFDDGYGDFLRHAVPTLTRYGFTATVFVVAGRMGGSNSWDDPAPRKPLMTPEEVAEARAQGMEIGSHGWQHVRLPPLADGDLAVEVERSRTELAELTGDQVGGFCYPYGEVDERVVGAVRAAGYDYACAVTSSPLNGRHALPRVYVGERDGAVRLLAKDLRRRLRDRASAGV